jgi:adenylate cyclase
VTTPPEVFEEFNPIWHDLLSGEKPVLRRGRHFFRMISPRTNKRCRLCEAPFEGIATPALRWFGRGPWHRNPHYCENCEAAFRQNRGGAEMDIAVLFADVRGSTPMAARMRPIEFGALMQRFYLAATKVFRETDAIVDKMVGDEVIGLYFPGLVDLDYRHAAARAGMELLRVTGHGAAQGPWLSIGVGVHAGKAFVGSLGDAGGAYEFAVLGDTMNVGARIASAAEGGEIIVSDSVWPHIAEEMRAEQRTLDLKGIAEPMNVHAAFVT